MTSTWDLGSVSAHQGPGPDEEDGWLMLFLDSLGFSKPPVCWRLDHRHAFFAGFFGVGADVEPFSEAEQLEQLFLAPGGRNHLLHEGVGL